MADPKWLKNLAGTVDGAVKEIARLRRQNKSLKTQLDKAKAAAAEAKKSAEAAEPEGEGWKAERKEVRRRVARLAKTLEELQ